MGRKPKGDKPLTDITLNIKGTLDGVLTASAKDKKKSNKKAKK